jgi:lysyl endopeptidase
MLRYLSIFFATLALPAASVAAAITGPAVDSPLSGSPTLDTPALGFTPERAFSGAPEAVHAFRAPRVAAQSIALPALAPTEKAQLDSSRVGRMQIGVTRALPKAAAPLAWAAADGGGFVARFDVASAGAAALRVGLQLPSPAVGMEVRVRGIEQSGVKQRGVEQSGVGKNGVAQSAPVEALLASDIGNRTSLWTPMTEGAMQTIEVFSPRLPGTAVSIAGVSHMAVSVLAPKVANPCSPDAACTTGDAALDAAVTSRRKSVARMTFQSGGGAFFCTGTLINSERAPEPMFLTANHCIATAAEAASLTTLWFYERTCAGTNANTTVQRAGGAELIFTNSMVDSTLLRLNQTPPDGVVFAATDATRVADNTAMVALSHPTGDFMKLGRGTLQRLTRPTALFPDGRTLDPTYDLYRILFSRGLIEGGSSGSGIFRTVGGELALSGILSTGGAPANIANCEATGGNGNYARYEIFAPMISSYLARTAPTRTDDHGNRIGEASSIALNTLTAGRINYAGDVDVYRVQITRAGQLSARTIGTNIDVVGALMTADGTTVYANDDGETSSNHFGITYAVTPGTYYLMVGHFEPAGTGGYTLETRFFDVSTPNYTDIWWADGESGWGLTLNHQDNTIFGALYTYDANRNPLWAVMPAGARQADGSYSGDVFTATGPPFNASPWRATTATRVGSMRLVFNGSLSANLTYDINAVAVSKLVTRFGYSSPRTTCRFAAEDRSFTFNVQDLWWTAGESGWGLNVVQQGSTVFAALYTYDANGRPVWFTMPQGVVVNNAYTGDLFRASGPAFNTTPWVNATATRVGSMSITPDETTLRTATLTYTVDGTAVTKRIERFVYGELKPWCEAVR